MVSGPSNGSVTLNAKGSFTYGPNFLFFGIDSFTYAVSDGNGGTDTATVTIDVGLLGVDAVHEPWFLPVRRDR